jgi:chromosome partitioning protein
MRIIAVVNQKGGCGKTTISINISSALAEMGKRTLLIDMDPQSHCAVGLAVPEEQIEQSIYDVLISKSRNEAVRLKEILWQIADRFDLAPASIDLSAFEQQMAGIVDRESCLKKVLDDVKNDFDFVIIDCPPAVSLLTFNALRAATDVIVPVETGYFSLHGLSRQLETLSILCERSGQKIDVKVVASMYDIRTKMAREIMSELRSCFGGKMFRTIVNFNTKLKEAASFGQPICEYDPASKGRTDFHSLADEVINSRASQQREEIIGTLSSQLESISSSAEELLKSTKPAAYQKRADIVMKKPQAVTVENQVSIGAGNDEIALELEEELPSPAQQQHHEEVSTTSVQVQNAKPFALTIEEKLSDYYGVNQINEAIVFVTLYPRAKKVQVAGDFNNWQPEKTDMQKVGTSGIWQTRIKLPPGKHQYRLVVDGQWQQDPYNEKCVLNPFGGFNSIVEAK